MRGHRYAAAPHNLALMGSAMDAAEPTRKDFDLLYKFYLEAVQSLPKITEGRGGPVYPPDMRAFIDYVRSSVWYVKQTDLDQSKNALQHLPSVTFEQLGWVFYHFARCEHWLPGYWEDSFKQGTLALVIARADQLTAIPVKPSREDFEHLQELYKAAMDSLPEINEMESPVYPSAMRAFIDYVTSSGWYVNRPSHDQYRNALNNLPKATLEQLGWIFCGFAIAEHWDPGYWREVLANGTMALVIERAGQLTTGALC